MKKTLALSSLMLSSALVADCPIDNSCQDLTCCCYNSRNTNWEQDECTCWGTFGIGANWLSLTPRVTEREYARVISDAGSDRTVAFVDANRKCVGTNRSSGYEVYLYYQSPLIDCCYAWDARVSFTELDSTKNSSTTVEDPLFLTQLIGFIPDNNNNQFLHASIKMQNDYDAVSAEFGWNLFSECCFNVRLLTGLHYAKVSQKIDSHYNDAAEGQEEDSRVVLHERARFRGIGPRFGMNTYWDLFCGFGFFADFSTNLLIAEKKGSFFQQNFDPGGMLMGLDTQWKEDFCTTTEVVPNLDIRIGLSYRFSWCLNFLIEGGYRATHYYNGLQSLKIAGNDLGQTLSGERLVNSTTWTTNESFGLEGWFLGGAISF
ncbi:MAG: hypothetical protein KR126chlam1_01433 [Chlamydiae bacterium]|nr:hypothetical protein [Chlamydiota bacterium]